MLIWKIRIVTKSYIRKTIISTNTQQQGKDKHGTPFVGKSESNSSQKNDIIWQRDPGREFSTLSSLGAKVRFFSGSRVRFFSKIRFSSMPKTCGVRGMVQWWCKLQNQNLYFLICYFLFEHVFTHFNHHRKWLTKKGTRGKIYTNIETYVRSSQQLTRFFYIQNKQYNYNIILKLPQHSHRLKATTTFESALQWSISQNRPLWYALPFWVPPLWQ